MSQSVSRYEDEVTSIIQEDPFTVFLCGPTMKDLSKNSAALRHALKEELQRTGFDVVLGEDDGLLKLQEDFGGDAQTNEIGFINKHAKAVVLIADSPGSFSELGLFSHHNSRIRRKVSFILVINKSFKESETYIELGPMQLVDAFGHVILADFNSPEFTTDPTCTKVITKLKTYRFSTTVKSDA